MSQASDLIERFRSVFDRPEFFWDGGPARIRFDLAADGEVEGWLAATEQDRFVLRRAAPDDQPPHLALSASAQDVARHLCGETDLFAAPYAPVRFDFAPGAPERGLSHERLCLLAERVLAGLHLSCAGRERFRGTLIEQLYLSWRSVRADGTFADMGGWSLPYYAGVRLYDMVTSRKPALTLEVGLAHGLSALFIAQAHHDNGRGRHVAIDPCQSSWFGDCGLQNLERANLAGYVEVVREPNYVALPRLMGQRFQMAFIDGLHIFDHVLLDFFYSDLLLEVGGCAVFDDSQSPGVQDALSFIALNRFDSYEREDSWSSDRITVLRKIAEDPRIERYGPLFHRRFAAAPLAPLSPAPTRRVLKNALDRALALLMAPLAAPVAGLIAVAIVAEDLLSGAGIHGPLQRTPRVSAGRQFDMIRFRTGSAQHAGSPDEGSGQHSPTRVGALLRKLRMQHLPLLWHVLTGRMSFVGLRPIHPGDLARRRLFGSCGVRAGLTGLHRDVDYHREYCRRGPVSLLAFDLAIAARTLAATLRRRVTR